MTLRRDVGYDLVYYLEENQRQYPGVSVQRVFVRRYPHGSTAAHVLGTVGEVSEEELEKRPYKRIEAGEEVGKGGVEYSYDEYLRGKPGVTRVQVNALGQPTPGGQLVSVPPTPGRQPGADARPEGPVGGRKRRSPNAGCRARSSRWTSTTARSSVSAPSRPTTRRSSRGR